MSRCRVVLCVIAFASTANAGVVVDLVPDQAGPYLGGESLTVDVWLQSEETSNVWLRMVQFDFTDTDPAIGLDDTFAFDLTPNNESRLYVRIIRFLDGKWRSDYGEETSQRGTDHIKAS